MAVDWREVLGWSKEQLDDLRLTGYGYLRQGHYERAAIFFEGLISLDPTSTYDYQTLGALYLQLGRHEEALVAVNRALELDPADLATRLNKAKTHLALGQRAEGLAEARSLSQAADRRIRNLAEALILGYSG